MNTIILTIFLTALLLSGDFLIKFASSSQHPIKLLLLAAILWSISVPGWFYTLIHNKLSIIGSLFAILSLIGTTLIGIIMFHEKLNSLEWLGLILAFISVFLLTNKL